MRKFVNDIGCEMNFDDDVSEEQIKERLEWTGDNWKEIIED